MNISIGKAVTLAIASAVLAALVTVVVLKSPPPQPQQAEETAAKPQAEPPVTAAQNETADDETAEAPAIDVDLAMQDRAIGAEDAPVTIIEYASMTCGHCAMFHKQVYPEVKKHLIDAGKAQLVFRDMPWDKHAVTAAKLARCAPHEQYFDIVGTIFTTHEHWVQSEDPVKALRDIGIAAGMAGEYVDACLQSEPLSKAVLEKMQEARRDYDIKSTPSFIFMRDGQPIAAYPEFQKIADEFGKHEHSH